jgi:hypothetical protein
LTPTSSAAVLAAMGSLCLVLAVRAARRRRAGGAAFGGLAGLLLLAVAGLLAAIPLATHGYRALTAETTAAVITVEPLGPHRFAARFRFPDGRQVAFELAGDELYVDAHVLKWKPPANLMGLDTAYELDRVAGRYAAIEDERAGPRTVHSLAAPKRIDLFRLRALALALRPLVDAEYGSATFVPAGRRAELELRVSTSGLLIRPASP